MDAVANMLNKDTAGKTDKAAGGDTRSYGTIEITDKQRTRGNFGHKKSNENDVIPSSPFEYS